MAPYTACLYTIFALRRLNMKGCYDDRPCSQHIITPAEFRNTKSVCLQVEALKTRQCGSKGPWDPTVAAPRVLEMKAAAWNSTFFSSALNFPCREVEDVSSLKVPDSVNHREQDATKPPTRASLQSTHAPASSVRKDSPAPEQKPWGDPLPSNRGGCLMLQV